MFRTLGDSLGRNLYICIIGINIRRLIFSREHVLLVMSNGYLKIILCPFDESILNSSFMRMYFSIEVITKNTEQLLQSCNGFVEKSSNAIASCKC